MSSNGLESLGDIGPGMTKRQTLNTSGPSPLYPIFSFSYTPPVSPLPQGTYLARNAYLLLWPRPSPSATTRQPPWWPRVLTCQRAPAARRCLPCHTLSQCRSIWRNATAASSKASSTVYWTASPRKLVKWVRDRKVRKRSQPWAHNCFPEYKWNHPLEYLLNGQNQEGHLCVSLTLTVSWYRIQSRVLSPPISPIQPWVSGLRTPRASRRLHPSFPRPSSARPSVTCPPLSLTRHWPSGTRAPPRRRTHWEASPRGLQTETRKWESQLAGLTRCPSTLYLVSQPDDWFVFGMGHVCWITWCILQFRLVALHTVLHFRGILIMGI